MGKVYRGVRIDYTPEGTQYFIQHQKVVKIKGDPLKLGKALVRFSERYEDVRIKQVFGVVTPGRSRAVQFILLEGYSRGVSARQIAAAHEGEALVREQREKRRLARAEKRQARMARRAKRAGSKVAT